MSHFAKPLFVVIALGFSACGSTATTEPSTTDASQSKWSQAGITDYEWTYTSTCGESSWFTDDPVTVQVTNDATEVVNGPEPLEVATVQKVLDLIAGAQTEGADDITAVYGDFGQPTQVTIDYFSDATDDEFCIDVTNFTPLGGDTTTEESSATSDEGVPTEIDQVALTSGSWTLLFGGGPSGEVALVDGFPITVTFNGDGSFTGTAGCNQYGGSYEVDLNQLTLGDIGWEHEGCEAAIQAAESAFEAGLNDADGINLSDSELVLSGPSTELIFTR